MDKGRLLCKATPPLPNQVCLGDPWLVYKVVTVTGTIDSTGATVATAL